MAKVCKQGHEFEGIRCLTCSRKYARERWHTLGLAHPRKSALQRFEENYLPEPMSGCWIWTAGLSKEGYGKLRHTFTGRDLAHRFAYWWFVGAIGEGLEIDHRCRNRACVNPQHLEAVLHQVNLVRGMSPVGINARKTHCLRGHEFSAFNTYICPRGKRNCRECRSFADRKSRQRERVF